MNMNDKVKAAPTEDEEATSRKALKRKKKREREKKRKAANKSGFKMSFGWKPKQSTDDDDESDSDSDSGSHSDSDSNESDNEQQTTTSSSSSSSSMDVEPEETEEEKEAKRLAALPSVLPFPLHILPSTLTSYLNLPPPSTTHPQYIRNSSSIPKGKSRDDFVDESGVVASTWINSNNDDGDEKDAMDEEERQRLGKQKFYITVNRTEEIQEQRKQLPIFGEEQVIMETIGEHNVVIICGQTGSGKTTQVPQFLYEAGYGTNDPRSDNPGRVVITQPRRVAATSTASRVADELNVKIGTTVGYQVRYDTRVNDDTALVFVTDGVLLKEIQSDFLLSRYSAILLDEAHERNLNTDILIGLLSRSVHMRNKMASQNKCYPNTKEQVRPLKLIIMSATLQIEDFTNNTNLFVKPPPVLEIEARQYPVTIHYAKETKEDYVNEAIKKVAKIHRRLPPGGVLVFMPGQADIEVVCRKLKKKFPGNNTSSSSSSSSHTTNNSDDHENDDEDVDFTLDSAQKGEEDLPMDEVDKELQEEIDGYSSGEDDSVGGLHVLPMYSMLAVDLQRRVFQEPPEGKRLVVVCTNVAETSLTIPGIRYVVDSGKVKEKSYEHHTGINKFVINWISQASAKQRAGRAGRYAESKVPFTTTPI
eukprot:TRINITY_DN676_c0_g1_i9.p1 TRINITY_DN676_c0_g1~~TRINITY_DN676_c0_g1_i9.p1  ORF type:complete len:646 (+),score=251.67 TRINITY_DN676_c0_g1_i9:1211-3148(+)